MKFLKWQLRFAPDRIVVWSLNLVVVVVWFFAFMVFVKPEVSNRAIPWILDFTEAQAEAGEGIDLDPIIASSVDSVDGPKSSLASSEYGYGQAIYGDLVTSDTRVLAMNRFLVDYHSPMAPHAQTFVTAADEVGLDWRLVAAISGVESGFGRIIPYNTNNGWGWRGGPGGAYSQFSTWDEGISHVTHRIAAGYGTNMDVFTMEPIYCPPCGQNPQHSWANGVTRYMNQLSDYQRSL